MDRNTGTSRKPRQRLKSRRERVPISGRALTSRERTSYVERVVGVIRDECPVETIEPRRQHPHPNRERHGRLETHGGLKPPLTPLRRRNRSWHGHPRAAPAIGHPTERTARRIGGCHVGHLPSNAWEWGSRLSTPAPSGHDGPLRPGQAEHSTYVGTHCPRTPGGCDAAKAGPSRPRSMWPRPWQGASQRAGALSGVSIVRTRK